MNARSFIMPFVEVRRAVGEALQPKSVDRWRVHWSGMAGRNDAVARNGYCIDGRPIANDRYREDILAPIVALLDLAPDSAVLDIGCGTGELLRVLEGRAGRLIGTDLSTELLSHYHGSAETLACEAASLPFAAGEFDRIVMVSVAHYFPSRAYFAKVVGDCGRFLRPGGLVVIGDLLPCYDRQYVPHLLRPFAWMGWQWWSPYRIYPPTYLRALASRLGLDITIVPRAGHTRVHVVLRKSA